jgi:hypothetical protein
VLLCGNCERQAKSTDKAQSKKDPHDEPSLSKSSLQISPL